MASLFGFPKGGLGGVRGPCSFKHNDGGTVTPFPLPSSSLYPPSCSHSSQHFSTPCHQGISSWTSLKGYNKANSFASTSVLFPPFCGTQERWPESSHYRPFFPEQAPSYPFLQDGNCVQHSFLHCGANVGVYGRPEGCFLPRPSSVVMSYLPGVCGGFSNLRFSGPSIWPFHCSLGLFQNYQAHQSSPSPFAVPYPYFPGQLPPPGSYQGFPSGANVLCPFSSTTSRYPYQLQEVSPPPFSDCPVLGGDIPSGLSSSLSSRGQGIESDVLMPRCDPPVSALPTPVRMPGRRPQLCLIFCAPGPSSFTARGELDEPTHFGRVERSSYPLRSDAQGASREVDRRLVLEVSCSDVSAHSLSTTYDGCIEDGLGRCSDSLLRVGNVADFLRLLLNQLAGAPGSVSFSPTLSSSPSRTLCPTPFRQYHGDSLHSPSRYSSISQSHGSFYFYSGVLLRSLYFSRPQTPQRLAECLSGPRVPLGANLNRVVPGRGHFPLGGFSLRPSPGGPVCHQGESSAPPLCLSLPGPGRSGGKRLLHLMGPLGVNLPIPSCSSAAEGLVSSPAVSRSGSFDCSILCAVKLASEPAPQVSGSVAPSFQSFSVADDQQRQSVPPKSFSVSASRVETIRLGLLAAGFNSTAADIYLLSHRASSTRQYQSVWCKFLTFLDRIGVPFAATSVGVLCNFLTHEATVNKLQYRTLTGYRSALRLPIYWCCGLEINTAVSNQFLRGLFNLRPPLRAAPMPVWNINVLLSYLQSDRFEPLDLASVDHLSQKTLCLILLASGRRISEIANLFRLHHYDPSGLSISLEWLPSFRPKHDDPGFQPSLPSISFLASDGSTDLSLCPVRAYHTFLRLSQPWVTGLDPTGQQSLWAQPGNPLPLNVRQLSKMFVKVVRDALADAGHPGGQKVGPHQMRKLSASLSRWAGHEERTLMKVMGFSSVTILRKNYVAGVPPLNIACVLPGGPYFPPGGSALSESDSE